MPLVERKYITRGSTTSGTNGTAFGYSNGTTGGGPGSTSFGDVHEFSSGSGSQDLITEFFSGAEITHLFYDTDTDKLYFSADAGTTDVPESPGRGWDTMTIGSTTFNRTDATYTTSSSGPYATWRWDNVSSSPFSSGINTVDWRNGGTAINMSINTRSSSTSQTQNVTTSQDIVVAATFDFGHQIITSNCEVVRVAGSSGGSTNKTCEYNIRFTDAGDYRVVFYQAYFNRAAVISGTVSGSQVLKGFGLTVNDANGKTRMSILDRQPRVVGSVSGTGSNNNFLITFSGYNNPLGEWLAVQTESGSNYSVDDSDTTVNKIRMQRADVRTTNNSYQVLSGSEDYRVIILRF